jgi:hypothetical protein
MKNTSASRIGILILALMFALPAHAQFDSSQISGVVQDSAGAVIPGVTVTAINEGTREERTVLTNEQGIYVFPGLQIATYTITAELPGFRRFVKTGNELSASVNIRVNVVLQVGEVTQTIEVQASTNEVVAETAVIGRSVGVREIAEIPLAGRNVALVGQFRAGVMGGAISTNPNSGAATFSNGGFSINGARGDEYVTTVDGGLSLRIRSQTGFTMGAQNIDTVQEVQVLTSNYQAELGRASGGLVRVVTKSGTREFHGVLFETHQNSALNANTWSRNASPDRRLSEKPEAQRYNSFGFALGGPIFIPGKFNADRSKLFFYIGEEWGRLRGETLTTATVPSLAMRNGDFSELLNPANPYFSRVRVITDPLTRQPFPNNVIPPDRVSPNGRALLNLYPLPTPGFQQGTSNWLSSIREWDNQRKDSQKIDYVINDRHRLGFRHSRVEHIWNQMFGLNSYEVAWVYPSRTTALTLTSTLSPTFLNEFTVATGGTLGNDRIPTRYCTKCVKTPNTYSVRSQTGLTFPFLFPGTKLDPEKISNISAQGLTAIATSQYPGASSDFVGTLTNNMTKISGPHTFKWGVTIERSGMKDQTQFTTAPAPGTPNQNGAFRFMDTGRTDATGLAIANAALGLFNDYSEFNTKPITHYVATAWDFFVQDSWKATSKLTAEIGVRYSLWPAWGSAHDALAEFHSGFYDPATAPVIDRAGGFIVSGNRFNGIVLPGCEPSEAALKRFPFLSQPEFKSMYHCLPNGFWETPKKDFQPRLGLAYALNSKTAVRSGVGMFLNRVQVNNSNPVGGNPPLMEMQTVLNGNADNPGGASRRDFVLNISMRDPKMKTPTAWGWNATVERELPANSKVSIAYVGRRGYFLERARNINQLLVPGTIQANPGVNPNFLTPFRGYSTITLLENTAVSKYNSLQIQFDRRSATGLGFNAAYTLSRNRDNASSKGDLFPNSYDGTGYYGISDLDRTHVLVFNYYYSFPRLSGAPAAARWVLGGWGISGTTQIQSGSPFSVTIGEDIAGVGPGSGAQFYQVSGDPKVAERTDFTTSAVWFNKDAFVRPAPGTFAPSMRGILRQPGFWDANLSVSRNFAVTEGQRFEFRWEAFNFLNHPRLGNATSNPTSGSFGLITSKAGNPRFMQLNLKYVF